MVVTKQNARDGSEVSYLCSGADPLRGTRSSAVVADRGVVGQVPNGAGCSPGWDGASSWDDVFTRTLSGVLTIGIIAVNAALAGLIQFDRQAWAIVAGVGGVIAAVIVANVWPVRYLPRQWVRWVIFWVLIVASIGIAWRLYGPIVLPQPSGECDDPLVC